MADTRIRDLERRRSQGDGAAETLLLLERLRAGQVAPERVELLAALGHEPARGALDPPPEGSQATELREWLWDLLPYGHLAIVRGTLALGLDVIDRFEERWPDATGPRDALEATAAWTEGETLDREALMQHEGYALRAAEDAMALDQEASMAAFTAFHVARTARYALEGSELKPFLYQAAQALNTALGVGRSEAELRASVHADLLDWALRQV